MRFFLLAVTCVSLWFGGATAFAAPITFIGNDGQRTASVTFEAEGTNLLIGFVNRSGRDAMTTLEVLTGFFFHIEGDIELTPVSARLAEGSEVLFGPAGPDGVVGGEWAYRHGLDEYGANSAVSAAWNGWFSRFDPYVMFPGGNLQGPEWPYRSEYGLTTAGDDPNTGIGRVTGDIALIRNAVDFVLSGLPVGFDPSLGIRDVTFKYATAPWEPSLPGQAVPVPPPLLLLVAGLVLLRRSGGGCRGPG